TFLSGALAATVLGTWAGPSRIAVAQGAQRRKARSDAIRARTVPCFKAPKGFPNALAGSPEGLWIGEQKLSGELARQYDIAEPDDLRECAWLVDWRTGDLKKTVFTGSRNTSGMAYGDGYIWMVAN